MAAVPIEFSNPDVDIDGTPSALVFEYQNKVRFYTRGTSGGWHFIEEPTDLVAGAWQCYAVVRRGGKKEIWRNGKLAIRDTAIDTRFVTSTSTILRVGKRSDGAGSPFDGMISLVKCKGHKIISGSVQLHASIVCDKSGSRIIHPVSRV